MFSFQEHITV